MPIPSDQRPVPTLCTQKRETIEAKNKLDSMVYTTEKLLKENRDKVASSDAATLESAIAGAKGVLEKDSDADQLNAAFDELTRASHKLAEAMYQKTADQQPHTPPPGAGGETREGAKKGKEEEVIDAEYVDMDDKKSQ